MAYHARCTLYTGVMQIVLPIAIGWVCLAALVAGLMAERL
jgi:hypothetical protein